MGGVGRTAWPLEQPSLDCLQCPRQQLHSTPGTGLRHSQLSARISKVRVSQSTCISPGGVGEPVFSGAAGTLLCCTNTIPFGLHNHPLRIGQSRMKPGFPNVSNLCKVTLASGGARVQAQSLLWSRSCQPLGKVGRQLPGHFFSPERVFGIT